MDLRDGALGWKGYYLSAYGLAVKHGYLGTEEQWLSSLKGDAVELDYREGKLCWRLHGENDWRELEEFTTFQQGVEERAQAAEEAADRANTAAASAKGAATAATEAAGKADSSAGQAESAAESASTAAQAANASKTAADTATVNANTSAQAANEAAASANSAADAAGEATSKATTATHEANTARDAANTASQAANASKEAADTAAANANQKAQEAGTAAQSANSAAAAAGTATENAQAQAGYAKTQGDRAAELVDKIEGTDIGGMAADILELQSGKADLVDGKVPVSQLPQIGVWPQVIVTAPIGNILECRCGSYILTDTSTGLNVFDLPDYGTWEIACTVGKEKLSETMVVDTAKQYKVTFTGYSAILKNNSWEEIAKASEEGVAPDLWEIGDETDIAVNGETLTFQIYDFGHDDLTGGGKAGITFGMKNLMAETRQMNSTNTNAGGFTGSDMYSWLQNTIFPALPEDLKGHIKAVDKKTSAGQQSTTIQTDSMKLFLFSECECFGTTTFSAAGEGSVYPIFTDNMSRIKYRKNGSGQQWWWWERSPVANDSTTFSNVGVSGNKLSSAAKSSYGAICFGFCI